MKDARWNLKVSRDTDRDLRAFLAERGGRKGDLSRFVERAVRRQMFRETLREVWERNAHLDPDEVQRIVDEAVAEVRRARRAADPK
jgi:Ribbon-helix-helix domain